MYDPETHIPARNVTGRDICVAVAALAFLVAALIVREFYSHSAGTWMFVGLMAFGLALLVFMPREGREKLLEHLKKPEKTGWARFLKYAEWALVVGVTLYLISRFFVVFRIPGFEP